MESKNLEAGATLRGDGIAIGELWPEVGALDPPLVLQLGGVEYVQRRFLDEARRAEDRYSRMAYPDTTGQ